MTQNTKQNAKRVSGVIALFVAIIGIYFGMGQGQKGAWSLVGFVALIMVVERWRLRRRRCLIVREDHPRSVIEDFLDIE